MSSTEPLRRVAGDGSIVSDQFRFRHRRTGPRGRHHGPADLDDRQHSVQGGLFATSPGDSEPIGKRNHTDWEKYHHASGAVEECGVVTVSGTGDIGPLDDEGRRSLTNTLLDLVLASIILLVTAAATAFARRARPPPVR